MENLHPNPDNGSADHGGAGGTPHPPHSILIHVVFNGVMRNIRVEPTDTVAATIASLRPLFGNPGGDLALVNSNGQVLAAGSTLGEQGVKPGDRLQLRPPVVQGG